MPQALIGLVAPLLKTLPVLLNKTRKTLISGYIIELNHFCAFSSFCFNFHKKRNVAHSSTQNV